MDRVRATVIFAGIAFASIISGCIDPSVFEGTDEELYTSFYLLGPGREPRDYPEMFKSGEEMLVYLGMSNHEGKNMVYHIEVFIINTSTAYPVNDLEEVSISKSLHPVMSITLADGQKAEIPCSFKVEDVGSFYLDFDLIIDGEIYRNLRLGIEVTEV
jgi:uncharacterized membrane protein